MNIIGNKEVLAFAYEEVEYLNGYNYGHFALIIRNALIGKYHEISTLSICNSYLKEFLTFSPKRVFEGSEELNKEELFHEIYEKFYMTWNSANGRKLSEYRDIFWLDEVGEYSFRDNVGIILIDEPKVSRQRIIWKMFENDELFEDAIPINYFDTIALEYLGKFK
jgi:hypothetical protein